MNLRANEGRFILSVILLSAFALFSSCTGHIGYGVINWSLPEHALAAGDVVPVFIQSNIGKVYVIGAGADRKKRVEVPLWQLTLYKSKSKASRAAKKLEEFRFTYATAKTDGLPVRAQSDNTSRQVYRLRLGQKLRIVRKGEGAPVVAGNAPLEGSWYEVLTDDGSTGWCFSYNLSIFDERTDASAAPVTGEEGTDGLMEVILSRVWYPDHYRTMVESNRIDINRISPLWGFFPGRDSGIARIELEGGVVTFPYTSITKDDERLYRFEGSTLTVQVRRSDSILVQYTDKDGMPQAIFFSSMDITPQELIEGERERREGLLNEIRASGPLFVSGNYGVLQFLSGGKFLWSGYQLLVPGLIPAGAGGGGTVEVRNFLGESTKESYDGVLSFLFDSTGLWVNFLYDLSPQGLKLEYVSASNIKDSVVGSRNINPMVIFFTPDAPNSNGQAGQDGY